MNDSPAPRSALAALGSALRRLLVPAPVVKVGLFFLASDTSAVVSVLGRLGVCHLDAVPNDARLDDLARQYACVVAEVPGWGEPVPESAEFRRKVLSAVGVVR